MKQRWRGVESFMLRKYASRAVSTFLVLHVLLFGGVKSSAADPAADDQPRVSGAAEAAKGWTTEQMVTDLEHPWSMTWLPDGAMLITERPGRLRKVVDGKLLDATISGLPAVYAQGQGGLFDIALHPKFSENSLIYFSYASGTKDANKTTLARARLVGMTLEDLEVLYAVPHAKSGNQHFGSRIAWLADGTLLLSVGDGGNWPASFEGKPIREYAQDLAKAFGKILRLKDDGSIPEDNPFFNTPGALKEIYSLGHRNIQGLYVDQRKSRVWANEHGSRGGDELNLIRPGANYGWPVVSHSREYYGPRVADYDSRPGMVDPVVVWTPSKAPSGLLLYTGDDFPHWRGSLLSGALAGQEVRRIALAGERAQAEESLRIGKRVRDVRQGPDKKLYLLIDADRGEVLRVVPTP